MLKMKQRQVPLVLRQEEALLRRLPYQHTKRREIEDSIGKRWAGYRGEQALDYHLDLLPYHQFRILHDIRLRTLHKNFQIDTLILTPQVGFILEVKNIAGTLHLENESGQFVRTLNGVKARYSNPLSQVKRQRELLKNWLHLRGVYAYPLHCHVVISNPETLLEFENEFSIPITMLTETVDRLKEVVDHYKNRGTFNMNTMAQSLISEDVPYHPNILSSYSVPTSQVLKGVMCIKCKEYSMFRVRQSWECSSCNDRSRKAHLLSLADYFLLFGSTLTNKRCRDFLGHSSAGAVSKMLSRMELTYTGATNTRTYMMPDNIEKWLHPS
ncbi:NERD domain-containing protein [Pontibacillus sp. ALD_SL1]|uniref:nuclease-related domain-containing protein n=1 Tax=Pontibacillus sp. ALD_SL1 TaxID=2777185 RepID=UPI001A95EEFB|nr:nuclease-related domain-containing protein [Pontibacillus sp. ALD_SL1]QSS99673.1 NERD domain-containing protein [Pontibacillus sp. ALD_SL1]